jgi:hypothetical protein
MAITMEPQELFCMGTDHKHIYLFYFEYFLQVNIYKYTVMIIIV